MMNRVIFKLLFSTLLKISHIQNAVDINFTLLSYCLKYWNLKFKTVLFIKIFSIIQFFNNQKLSIQSNKDKDLKYHTLHLNRLHAKAANLMLDTGTCFLLQGYY